MTRSQVSKRTAMVKAELAARGLSLSKIAAELEVGRAVVSLVLRGKRRSARIEQRLASAIGIEPASLWGDTAAAVLPTNTPGCASIKAQLQLKGWTFTALASTLNVSPSAIARVVHGESRSEKIETRIAELLKQERQALWPNPTRSTPVPRPKTNRTPVQLEATAGAVDDSALERSGAALDAQAQHLAMADQLYGLGSAYERESHVRQLIDLRQEVGSRLLRAGLLLLQMKEHEPAGQFYAACERAGYKPRFARKLMQVARSFGADPLRLQLADKLGFDKVLELVTEEDDDIDALAQGGELHGLTADEFARMTKREVIALLKREREDAAQEREATDEVMRHKDERINKLSKEKRIAAKSGPRAQVDNLLADLASATVEAATQLKRIRDTASAIQAAYAEAGQPLDEEVAQQLETNLETARGWAEVLTEELAQV